MRNFPFCFSGPWHCRQVSRRAGSISVANSVSFGFGEIPLERLSWSLMLSDFSSSTEFSRPAFRASANVRGSKGIPIASISRMEECKEFLELFFSPGLRKVNRRSVTPSTWQGTRVRLEAPFCEARTSLANGINVFPASVL